MATVFVNAEVLTPAGFRKDVAVRVEAGAITAVAPEAELDGAGAERIDIGGDRLVPGFIDTQVNGGGGVLFNDEPTVEGVAAIASAHRHFGTTGLLPTLISDDLPVIDRAMRAVEQAIEAGLPGVLGIHIEGPFLNIERKGIHDPSKLRTLDEEAFRLLTSLKRGVTLVTLAPEKTTPAMIRRLADAGVVVSAGHTAGTYADIRTALDTGLTGFTHLFNAMSPLTSRAPGAVGAALDDPTAYCGLIVDGHHVDPVTLKIALRCRPHDRFMLVTDAMPSVGHGGDGFMLQGRRIRVRDGICVDAGGVLAGAHLDMATAVGNAVRLMGVSLEEASVMASSAPAAFLGLAGHRGRIAPGQAADLVRLDRDGVAVATWIAGASSEAG